eukprot:SAG31_NODE_4210_length_3469_cov_11.547774_6_plen_94_part_00
MRCYEILIPFSCPRKVFDPHFHIWDINDESKGGYADPKTLFVPEKQKDAQIYNQADMEAGVLPACYAWHLRCSFGPSPPGPARALSAKAVSAW